MSSTSPKNWAAVTATRTTADLLPATPTTQRAAPHKASGGGGGTASASVYSSGSSKKAVAKAPSHRVLFQEFYRFMIQLVFCFEGTIFGSSVRNGHLKVPLGEPVRGRRSRTDTPPKEYTSDIDVFIPTAKYEDFIQMLKFSIKDKKGKIRPVVNSTTVTIAELRDRYGHLVRRAGFQTVTSQDEDDMVTLNFQLKTFTISMSGIPDLKIDIVTSDTHEFNRAQDVILGNMFIKTGCGDSIRFPLLKDGTTALTERDGVYQLALDELHHHNDDTGHREPSSSILFPAAYTYAADGSMIQKHMKNRLRRFMKAIRAGITPIHGLIPTACETFLVTFLDELHRTLISMPKSECDALLAQNASCPICKTPYNELDTSDETFGKAVVVLTHCNHMYCVECFTQLVDSSASRCACDQCSSGVKCGICRAHIK